MNKIRKVAIGTAAFALSAGLAVPAITAAAAPAAQASTTAAVVHQQGPSLSGWQQIKLSYGTSSTATYWVLFRVHRDGLLSGWMYDSQLPIAYPGQSPWLALHGDVSGNVVQFNVTYPAGDVQGTRSFTGTVGNTGHLTGVVDETGSEALTGTFISVGLV